MLHGASPDEAASARGTLAFERGALKIFERGRNYYRILNTCGNISRRPASPVFSSPQPDGRKNQVEEL